MVFRVALFRSDDTRLADVKRIRRIVFVEEQKVPPPLEWDGKDAGCDHFLLTDDDLPIGAARTRERAPGLAKIERMAVLKAYRGRGGGRALMNRILSHLSANGVTAAVLHAQSAALEFYRRAGFVPEGEPFDEAGIHHVRMRYTFPT